MLNSGERQVATQRQDVRADHRHRYEWAAKTLPANSYVIDLGCGIGYGAQILAEAGHKVFAVDRDIETITFARTHFAHPNTQFVAGDVAGLALPKADAAVCFEMIEHVADPAPMLAKIADAAPILLASVPNETAFPWREEYAFHHRHYTEGQFLDLLAYASWEWSWIGRQNGTESPVEAAGVSDGRTIIVKARHFPPLLDNQMTEDAVRAAPLPTFDGARERISPPDHVVIIGLGPSAEQYMDLCKRLGGRKRFADEVWAINALGDVLACDRIFHMDDVRVQEARANEAPNSNIAEMVKWLKLHPGPIITSRAHPDYPGLVEFPLEAVINDLGFAYFNGTAAYAAAYAIWLGVKKISLFGCDFTMANAHHAEKGRACLEFWLGVASARGIELGFADRTSLMDTCDDPADPGEIRPYGYDYDRVLIRTEDGAARISFEPKEAPPTAAEIEARYDHTAHPNPLVKPAAGA